MRRRSLLLVILLAACSSGNQDLTVIPPEITLLPLDIPVERPPGANTFASMLRLDVANRSSEPLVIERVELSSVGVGPFSIAPANRSFNFPIPTERRARVEMWVQVTAEETLGGAEGYITVRGAAYFRSGQTAFRRLFTQRMDVRASRRRPSD